MRRVGNRYRCVPTSGAGHMNPHHREQGRDVGMKKYRFSARAPDPRVLCVSIRDIAPVISRTSLYEFEDLIGAMDAVDVIAPADAPDPADAETSVQHALRTL